MSGQQTVNLLKVVNVAIPLVAVFMVLYQFAGIQFLNLSSIQVQNIHYAFALALVYLLLCKRKQKYWPLWLFLAVLSLVSTGYVYFQEYALYFRAGSPTTFDLFVGVSLIVVGFVATWVIWGAIMPATTLAFIVYSLAASYLPPPLTGISPSFSRLISQTSIGLVGLYGTILGISANMLFYFMLFSSVFRMVGAGVFFEEIGKVVGRISKGGPAQTAVVTSALFGTISGSIMGNVATTGSFTIPAMKRAGFKPETAGAFEASASTGGQIMPPVMGAAAFVMAGFLGIPYLSIIGKAAIPAVLFFFSLAVMAELLARKYKIAPSQGEKVNVRELILRAPLFGVPLGLLVIFLLQGHSVRYSILASVVAMVVLSLIRKATRPSPRQFLAGFTDGASTASELAVSFASLSPVTSLVTYTGLGIKLPGLVMAWSHGIPFLALLITWGVAIILGLPASTIVVYLLVAVIAAPALVQVGFPLFPIHMFAFYYAVLGAVTPPVAQAALVACRIAGSPFGKTAWEASRLSCFNFILPFLFVFNPVLLGYFSDPVSTVSAIIATVLLASAIAIAVADFYILTLGPIERVTASLSAVALAGYVIAQRYPLLFVGLALFALLTLRQLARRRQVSQIREPVS